MEVGLCKVNTVFLVMVHLVVGSADRDSGALSELRLKGQKCTLGVEIGCMCISKEFFG